MFILMLSGISLKTTTMLKYDSYSCNLSDC